MQIDFELLYRLVIAVDILLCAAIIVCNLLLLLSILFSKRARARTRNVMLVSVCVADLLVGAFTHPVYIHSYHTGTLFHSCEMHILMQLIGDYSQDFVCFWTLVTLGTTYMYRLAAGRWGWGSSHMRRYGRLSPPASRCDSFVRISKKALLVGWPWLGTLLIPIPILMSTVEQRTRDAFWDETFCPLHTPFPSRMVVLVLVFYLPMAAMLLLCVGLALLMHWDSVHAKHTARARALASRHAGGSGGGRAVGVEGEEVGEEGGEEANGGGVEGKVVYRGGRGGVGGEHGLMDPERVFDHHHHAALAQDGGDADRRLASPQGDTAFQSYDGNTTATTTTTTTIHTQDIDPSVTLVSGRGGGGGGRREGGGADEDAASVSDPLDRPVHVLVPLLVTVVCALPLMVGWWFYSQMARDTVIIVSVTLSRVYLLRAALLPVSWFGLPELRTAACRLWDRVSRRRRAWSSSETNRETGEFSVAYTTLRESRDAPGSASDGEEGGRGGEGGVRRQNPFDPNFVRV
ncbi:uncharacterized protein LOC143286418 [Babylonia areolata]|uniref:uncharacterized protein LOC143286418 n=1 Tax=Babylonia areolata TaxID=304850 RepID=UPI003FCF14D7